MTNINKQQILTAINKAWQDLEPLIFEANQDAIKAKIYEWNENLTQRINGELVGSPRDIVDTSALLNSQSIAKNGDTYHLDWDVEYAADVHQGTENTPARPWTTIAIAGDATADPDYQNPTAFLDVPSTLASRYRANY